MNSKQKKMDSIYLGVRKLLKIVVVFSLLAGCKKLTDVSAPVTSVTGASVYTTDATAASVLTGLYTKLSATTMTANAAIPNISFWGALSADELTLWSGVTNTSMVNYYRNNLAGNTNGFEFWNDTYPYIYSCNDAIQGLNGSTSLTPAVKQELLGEAMFMRAFFYFYLTNLYGAVPVPLGINYKQNDTLTRIPQGQVYQQVITDLKAAQGFLSPHFLDATLLNVTTERTRPTQWAAAALLAKAYLYSGDWADAEAQSTALINNTSLFKLDTLNGVFLKNSTEAIWQLQPVSTPITNSQDAYTFVIPGTGPSATLNPVYISSALLNAFETGDLRKSDWIHSVTAKGTIYYYPFKYKVSAVSSPVTEYLMMLRLGEQYLIRAEARAEQNNLAGCDSDLNVIRRRAGLADTTAPTQAAALPMILHERQVELFTELANRWLDLKRTGSVDSVMNKAASLKGTSWQTYQQLYPIPQTDILTDAHLSQNNGY